MPLTMLVGQLTEYCRKRARENLDQQAEWLDLVARLILWKSRALCHALGGSASRSDADDSRREFLRELLSLEDIRAAGAGRHRLGRRAASHAVRFAGRGPPAPH